MKTQFVNIKKLLKGFILVSATLFLSQGLQAQKSIKSYEFKELTTNLFKSSDEILAAMKSVKFKKAFYEEEIVLEQWMTDLNYWAKNLDSSAVIGDNKEPVKINVESELETEVLEESLELEDWMLNYEWIEKENIMEEELKFEDWMQSPKKWNIYASR